MIWILQNQDRVPAGRYGALLDSSAQDVQIVPLYKGAPLPDLRPGDRVLSLGGTMSFDDDALYPWLTDLKQFLRAAAEADHPLLCICLSAQLLAHALGGNVTRNHYQERGVSRIHLTENGRHDPLLSELDTTFPVLQWHNDSFGLPAGCTHLATSNSCPVQAFRYHSAYALQFHPEVDLAIVRTWNASLTPPGFYDKEFAFAAPDWQPTWDRLLQNFLQLQPHA